MLQRCSKCVLPQSYPGITFDKKGVCSYCVSHRKVGHSRKAELSDLVEPYRNKDKKYDCIVAISGGRDSAFAAHYAAKILNLRVLTYTYDNGFMPDQTKENVKNIVDVLGVDHVTEEYDYVKKSIKPLISSWMHKPSPAMIGLLCTGCRTGLVEGLAKIAQNTKTPLIITGSGEEGLQGPSFAERLLMGVSPNRKGKKLSLLLGFMRESIRNPYYILSPNCSISLARDFSSRFLHKRKSGLKIVPLFEFIEWDEQRVHSVIKSELQWETPPQSKSSWRSDCKIHLLRQYLYKETLGFTKNDIFLSVMIRKGMITREEALERLESENQISEQFLTAFFDELGLDFSKLAIALREYKEMTGKP